jgi:hypothetical protein
VCVADGDTHLKKCACEGWTGATNREGGGGTGRRCHCMQASHQKAGEEGCPENPSWDVCEAIGGPNQATKHHKQCIAQHRKACPACRMCT